MAVKPVERKQLGELKNPSGMMEAILGMCFRAPRQVRAGSDLK